jgi:hypothetical protein
MKLVPCSYPLTIYQSTRRYGQKTWNFVALVPALWYWPFLAVGRKNSDIKSKFSALMNCYDWPQSVQKQLIKALPASRLTLICARGMEATMLWGIRGISIFPKRSDQRIGPTGMLLIGYRGPFPPREGLNALGLKQTLDLYLEPLSWKPELYLYSHIYLHVVID